MGYDVVKGQLLHGVLLGVGQGRGHLHVGPGLLWRFLLQSVPILFTLSLPKGAQLCGQGLDSRRWLGCSSVDDLQALNPTDLVVIGGQGLEFGGQGQVLDAPTHYRLAGHLVPPVGPGISCRGPADLANLLHLLAVHQLDDGGGGPFEAGEHIDAHDVFGHPLGALPVGLVLDPRLGPQLDFKLVAAIDDMGLDGVHLPAASGQVDIASVAWDENALVLEGHQVAGAQGPAEVQAELVGLGYRLPDAARRAAEELGGLGEGQADGLLNLVDAKLGIGPDGELLLGPAPPVLESLLAADGRSLLDDGGWLSRGWGQGLGGCYLGRFGRFLGTHCFVLSVIVCFATRSPCS